MRRACVVRGGTLMILLGAGTANDAPPRGAPPPPPSETLGRAEPRAFKR
jgi:hypothetical protein